MVCQSTWKNLALSLVMRQDQKGFLYKILIMRVLQLVMVMILAVLVDAACGNSSCSNDCISCTSEDTCTNCCWNFGIKTHTTTRIRNSVSQSLTVAECIRCTDIQCNSCSFDSSGVQTCNSCQSGYGVLINYPQFCVSCTANNAYACRTLNDCDNPLRSPMFSCASCNTYTYLAPDKCMPCGQVFRQCEQCSSSQCHSCVSNYYLNTSNNQECVPCTFHNCLFCTHGPVCYKCISGFYKDAGNVCQHCSIPCSTCSSSTTCQSCLSNRYYLTSGTCVLCLDLPETPNCINCSSYYDTTINQTVYVCYACLNGSYLDSDNACVACVSPCDTCSSLTSCSSCDNDTYYLSSSNVCEDCSNSVPHCLNCLTEDICIICEDGYNIIVKPDECTRCSDAFQSCENCTQAHCTACVPGYIMNANFKCEMNLNCGSNCTSCEVGFPNNCITCPSGYYVDNYVCLPCLAVCMTCSSGSNCLLCHANYYYANNTCTACPNRTYYLDTLKDCINCSAYCNACTVLGCDSCDPLFSISEYDHQCIDTCGDGYIVTLPCDATIGIANDGCTDTCQIQQNYNCTYVNQSNSVANSNVTTVQVSTCSYIGDISISLSKASQALFANQVQLTFKISPYLHGMPDGSESQVQLRTIFDLAPFTDFTISINPNSEQVTFTIPYQTDISTVTMSLSVNYQNLTANPMFQYTTNKAKSLQMNEILTSGRLGEYHQASQYSLNKSIYVYCFAIVILSYLLFLVGLVSRQLAALENMILYQTIFLLVAFRQGPCNFYLEGLIALRYSTGFDFSGKSSAQISNTKFYNYGINTQSLLYQYNMHFYILFVPIIISFFFMLYRIKNKHLPVKHDFGRSVAEELIGYTLLYFITFNFYGLFTYTYMYMHSKKVDEFWNFTVLGASLLLTIFSWFNLIFRPEAVGSFRSAFGSYKNAYFVEQSKVECVRKIEGFFKWRIKSEEWKEKYHKFTTNFFFFLLAYQIAAAFCIISNLHVVLLAMQILIFVLLFMTKPYLKIVENARSLLLFLTLILSNFISFTTPNGYMLTLILSVLMLFHLALTIFTTVKFAKFEILKQCNQRSKVVREIFRQNQNIPKAELHAHHKEVINELIEKYHQLGIQDKLQAYSPSKGMKLSDQPEKIQRQVQKQEKPQQKKEPSVKDEVSQQEHMYTEQRILAEQNQHLRFLQGMQFYCKYGNELDNQLVKQHYSKV